MAKVRLQQLAQEYRKEIADIVSYHLKDDDISGLVSVLSVDVSADLRHANVYVSIFQPDAAKKKRCFQALVRNAAAVRRELAHRMTQRTVPELVFREDSSMDYSAKINDILKTLDVGDPSDGEENN